MGGPGKWNKDTVVKIVMADLIGHSTVRVKFTLYKFGDWRNSSLFFTVDDKEPESTDYT